MFFYEPLSGTAIVSVLLYLVFLIGMNELSRLNKWVGGAIFIALPTVLTIFVWPHTAVEGTGAGTWFQWVKTYSCLVGMMKAKPDITDDELALLIAQTLRLDMTVMDPPPWPEHPGAAGGQG